MEITITLFLLKFSFLENFLGNKNRKVIQNEQLYNVYYE